MRKPEVLTPVLKPLEKKFDIQFIQREGAYSIVLNSKINNRIFMVLDFINMCTIKNEQFMFEFLKSLLVDKVYSNKLNTGTILLDYNYKGLGYHIEFKCNEEVLEVIVKTFYGDWEHKEYLHKYYIKVQDGKVVDDYSNVMNFNMPDDLFKTSVDALYLIVVGFTG